MMLELCQECKINPKYAKRNLCNTCRVRREKNIKNGIAQKNRLRYLNCKNCHSESPVYKLGLCQNCFNKARLVFRNKNRENTLSRERYLANPEKQKSSSHKYNKKQKELGKPYNGRPVEKARRYRNEWLKAHPFQAIASRQNNRAKKYGHYEVLKAKDLIEFSRIFDYCVDCGSKENLTFGHKIPIIYPTSSNSLNNIVRQCLKCNNKQKIKVHHLALLDDPKLSDWYPIHYPNLNIAASRLKRSEYNFGLIDKNYQQIARRINRHARRYGHFEQLTDQDLIVKKSEFFECLDCGDEENLTYGHLIPLFLPISRNTPDNLIRQCLSCNSRQGTKVHWLVANENLQTYYRVYYPQSHKKSLELPNLLMKVKI